MIILHRISIVMDDELVSKLRAIQAKRIQKNKISVSFSRVVNDILRKGLQKS